MNRSISFFGLDHDGLATPASPAYRGNYVISIDLNRMRVEGMHSGNSLIMELWVSEIISESPNANGPRAVSSAETEDRNTKISFHCVGTRSPRHGKLDHGHVETVCREIDELLKKKNSFNLVVLRSKELPGTAETIVVRTMGEDCDQTTSPDFVA